MIIVEITKADDIAHSYNAMHFIQNENPGPGSYAVECGGALETERTSFSKKGLGGFASKVRVNGGRNPNGVTVFYVILTSFSREDFLVNKCKLLVLDLTTPSQWRTE